MLNATIEQLNQQVDALKKENAKLLGHVARGGAPRPSTPTLTRTATPPRRHLVSASPSPDASRTPQRRGTGSPIRSPSPRTPPSGWNQRLYLGVELSEGASRGISGCYVMSVRPGGPANRAGIQVLVRPGMRWDAGQGGSL